MHTQYEIKGSEGRDYAMLERNLLSHLRLAMLLSLSSASLLLHTRLPTPSQPGSANTPATTTTTTLSAIEVSAAVAAIMAGVWEYWQGYADMKSSRGFLRASQIHLVILSIVGIIVFATCVTLIVNERA